MSPIQRHGVTRRWSDAVVYNGTAHFVEVADWLSVPSSAWYRISTKLRFVAYQTAFKFESHRKSRQPCPM